MNRRNIIIALVIIAVVFMITKISSCGKEASKKQPLRQTEIILENAVELKNNDPQMSIAALEKLVSDYPDTMEAQKALLEIAGIYEDNGDVANQKQVYNRLIQNYPDSELTKETKEELWAMNLEILFVRSPGENSFLYSVEPGDSLYKIAKKHNTTVDLIMKSNGLSGSLIKPGMKLKIIKADFNIIVSKSNTLLTLKSADEVVKEYPIGIGDNNSTPVGEFKIVNRIVDPVWYKTGAIVAAGSPENILGTRWLGISEPGYGIHGTTDTQPITQQKTQGCVRMMNEDVEELFMIVPVGTRVVIND